MRISCLAKLSTMKVLVRVPCRAGSAWNSGACSTVKLGAELGQLRAAGADEHVPDERARATRSA